MKKPHPWVFKLMVAFSKLTPNCPEISRLTSASLDRRLTWRERIAVRAHFLICSWCRRYQHQLRFLRSAARKPRASWAALLRAPAGGSGASARA